MSLKVNAVVYFRVVNAIIEVENFRFAVELAAQTSLRTVLGEVEVDDLLAQREKLNARLQTILDEHTETWGLKIISGGGGLEPRARGHHAALPADAD